MRPRLFRAAHGRWASCPWATALIFAALPAAVLATAPGTTPSAPGTQPGSSMTARLTAPKRDFTVGDPVELILEVIHPQGAVVDPPDPGALKPKEEEDSEKTAVDFALEGIVPAAPRDGKSPPAGSARTAWRVVIRPFAPGTIEIPSLTVSGRLPGRTDVVTAATEPVAVTVKSVLHDAAEAPADIKGPWTIPEDITRWLIIGLAALAAVVVALILWRRYRAKRRPVAAVAAAPAVVESAWARALRELEELLAARLIEQGRIKEFHVALAEIVKRFLGEHHVFDALDRTSEEVLADLRRMKAGRGVIERTEVFLTHCDLVKFAKHTPARPEIDETVGEARALIETGRPSVRGAAA